MRRPAQALGGQRSCYCLSCNFVEVGSQWKRATSKQTCRCRARRASSVDARCWIAGSAGKSMAESSGVPRVTGADDLIWIGASQILGSVVTTSHGLMLTQTPSKPASAMRHDCGLVSGNELTITTTCCSLNMASSINNVAITELLVTVIKLIDASGVWIKWHCVSRSFT